MTGRRFLLLFAVTNTLAVGAVSAVTAGGALAGVGAVLAVLAVAAFVATARVVLLSGPVPRGVTRETDRVAHRLEDGRR